MTPEDIKKDSVGLVLSITEDEMLTVSVISNLSEDVSTDTAQVLLDTINGLNAILSTGIEMVSAYGTTLRYLREEMELNDGGIVFEPDEELEKAVAERNVIKFDKSRLN
jgi:hypothetical protein